MFTKDFGYNAKSWQIDVAEHSFAQENAVIALSRRTGDGKTLAMSGAVRVTRGVTVGNRLLAG